MTNPVRVKIQLEALSPLTFGMRRGTSANFMDTLDYVPGTSLRGAAAARYLREFGNADDERFQDIFLRGGVLFGNLYPVSESELSSSYVLPATAYACKAHKEKHGVRDILIRAAALRLDEERLDQRLIDEITTCRHCPSPQPAHHLAGFYEKRADGRSAYNLVEVHKRHLTHVGINRRTQTAEDGLLYAQQVINEAKHEPEDRFTPQFFGGELIVSQDHFQFVATMLMNEKVILRVGESRTRGLGKIQVCQSKLVERETENVVRNRLTEFNQHFSRQSPRSTEGGFLALTLQSDVILTDTFMRPKNLIDADDIRQALSDDGEASLITPESLRLIYANSGTRLVQSWNAASRYPKPDDLAITMGGVFLFEVAKDLWAPQTGCEGTETDRLARLLMQLQEKGVGNRLGEGFGRVTVCDSFHWEVQELWQAI